MTKLQGELDKLQGQQDEKLRKLEQMTEEHSKYQQRIQLAQQEAKQAQDNMR